MSVAFRAKLSSTQKLVLLALCDSANDQGECYPSVTTLVEKCSLTDRAIQAAIADLESMEHLRREPRNGRSTVYWMTPYPGESSPPNVIHPRTTFAPERHSPPKLVHPTPERRSPPPPNVVHPTPERHSPITITEPSVEPPGNRKRKADAPEMASVPMLTDAGLDLKTAADFIAHKAAKKSPLTMRAWADHCREAAKAGWTAAAAADKVMARDWRGFEATYVAGSATPNRGPPQQQDLAAKNAEAHRLVFGHQPTSTEALDA